MRDARARWLIIPLFALWLGLLSPAQADVTISTVSVKGRVEYREGTQGEWKKVYKGTRLRKANFVRTYEDAEIVLKIGERGMVTVHELSTVVVSAVAGSDAAPKSRLELLVGKLWAKFTKDDEPQAQTAGDDGEEAAEPTASGALTIGTPAAVASVRGTAFYVESDQQTKNARIGVWEGLVVVRGNHDARKSAPASVAAGFEIVVLYNKPLIDPRKMAIERIREEGEFNRQIQSLGMAGLFARNIMETNKILMDEATTTVKEGNLQKRGEKIVREDFEKIKTAIAKLYADTGFMPGKGFNAAGGARTLVCLTKNDNGRGEEIPNWAGPYMDSDFKDPFGGEYCVYQKSFGNSTVLMLVSLGLDKTISNDDIQVPFSERALNNAAEALK